MRFRPLLVLSLCVVLFSSLSTAQQPALKSGLDPAGFDKSVRPQDDLFRYVNGTWLAKTELPADRAIYGTFVQLSDKAEADLYALIEELAGDKNKKPGSTAQQVGDFYASFIDEAKVNAAGAAPLKAHLAEIDAVKTPAEMAALIGKLSMVGLPGPVGGFVEADAGDPTKVALYLQQGGIGMPNRDYYLRTIRHSPTSARSIRPISKRSSRSPAVRMPPLMRKLSSPWKPSSRRFNGRTSRAATR